MQTLNSTRKLFIKDRPFDVSDDLLGRIAKSGDGARISMPWPGAKNARRRIVPVFMPFAGCPTRCIFCSQENQTGASSVGSLAAIRERLEKAREALFALAPNVAAELAFYGGTFTAQRPDALALCLEFAAEMRAKKRIAAFRCSTRPDCVSPQILRALLEHGCEMVEFGVQSFSGRALSLSRRGYGPEQARVAIALAKEAGLMVCAQLMPGIPGQTPEEFGADVALAARLGVDALRFYPCQVLAGTGLAEMWRKGAYQPWSLALTIRQLARASLLANLAQIPVIRTGLAPQAGLEPLAGPAHPSLGGLMLARALMLGALLLARSGGINDLSGRRLIMPRNAQGYYAGQKNCLMGLWRKLGFLPAQFAFDKASALVLERLQ